MRPDFTIDEAVIQQASNMLGLPFADLLADAQIWASASKFEFEEKQRQALELKGAGGAGGGGTGEEEWFKGESFKDEITGEPRFVFYSKDGTRIRILDANNNVLNEGPTEGAQAAVPSQSGAVAGGVLGNLLGGGLGGALGSFLGGLTGTPEKKDKILLEKIPTGLKADTKEGATIGGKSFIETEVDKF